MTDFGVVEKILSQLVWLEEDQFVACYHQRVEKERKKAWPERHIKFKWFNIRYLVLLYVKKIVKHRGKF